MELVFHGPPAFLNCLAVVLPTSTRDERPVESMGHDNTAFVCPVDSLGLHLDPVYDSKAMFRGSQVNLIKTVERLGRVDPTKPSLLPAGAAIGLSVWGSDWLIASADSRVTLREKGYAAYDAFSAAFIVARSLPGVTRLVCPPLCVRPGGLSYIACAAQIARAHGDVLRRTERASRAHDSRGMDCYVAIFSS